MRIFKDLKGCAVMLLSFIVAIAVLMMVALFCCNVYMMFK